VGKEPPLAVLSSTAESTAIFQGPGDGGVTSKRQGVRGYRGAFWFMSLIIADSVGNKKAFQGESFSPVGKGYKAGGDRCAGTSSLQTPEDQC